MKDKNTSGMAELLDIMAALRDPERGCPWDLQQDFDRIAAYTIEEAYEVVDAIGRRDWAGLCDELGDLLLQVVFHARMAEEAGYFAFPDVVKAIRNKMLQRHPHVFGDAVIEDAEAQTAAWEAIKAAERATQLSDTSALAGIPRGLPEWQRTAKLQKRAARIGFEWHSAEPILDKLREEIEEVRQEVNTPPGSADRHRHLEDEIGDVLFVALNLARRCDVDAGSALRRANAKFERRFRRMEELAAQNGQSLAALPLPEQETLWTKVKAEEKQMKPL